MRKREAQHISDQVIEQLSKVRKQKKISLGQIESATGLSKSSLSAIERLKQKPALYTVVIIANFLEINLGEILNNVSKK